jgi:gluconate 2-dehydrogenase
MRASVLVTRASFPDIVDRLRANFDVTDNPEDTIWTQPELIARLQGKTGAMTAGSDRIDATLLDACPQLRAVCNIGVGYNNVDVEACTARGVLVTNTPDVLTDTTADFGFALIMATARRISESEHFLRAGEWTKTGRYDMFVGSDVHGSTLGILGMGRIGQAIARRGAFGFGMRVIYHNRSQLAPDVEEGCRARYVDKETLLRESDHLIVVVPYSASSHHAIGAAELKQMKSSATLTNIARGGVVDDAALAQHRGGRSGRLRRRAGDLPGASCAKECGADAAYRQRVCQHASCDGGALCRQFDCRLGAGGIGGQAAHAGEPAGADPPDRHCLSDDRRSMLRRGCFTKVGAPIEERANR